MKNDIALKLGIAGALGLASSPASAAVVDAAPGFLITTLAPFGFTDSGSTAGLVNNFTSIPPGLTNYTQVAGPDAIYKLIVQTGGSLNFTVAPSAGYDVSIYLLSGTAATGEGLAASNAIAGSDSFLNGATETLSINVAPGTYYFVVDSFYTAPNSLSSGTYDLAVTGSAVLAVPEPSAPVLVAAAGVGLLTWRNRRRGAVAR